MKDPSRIPRILKKLEQQWLKGPSVSLGQIMANIAMVAKGSKENIDKLSDNELEDILDRFNRVDEDV